MARPCHGPDVRRYGPQGCRPGRCRGQEGPGHGHVNPARPRPGRPRRGRDMRRPHPARIRPRASPPRTRPGRRRGIPIDGVTPRRPRPLPARFRRTPRHPRGAGTLDPVAGTPARRAKRRTKKQRFRGDFEFENASVLDTNRKQRKKHKHVDFTKRFQTTRKVHPVVYWSRSLSMAMWTSSHQNVQQRCGLKARGRR